MSIGDDGRILVHCFAGCQPEQILEAIALDYSSLFSHKPRLTASLGPKVQKQARAARGLEEWRGRQLTINCHLIREFYELADGTVKLLAGYERTHTGTPDERDEAWSRLAFCYDEIPQLEDDHDRLNSRSRADHLEVWRQYREVLDAAS